MVQIEQNKLSPTASLNTLQTSETYARRDGGALMNAIMTNDTAELYIGGGAGSEEDVDLVISELGDSASG